MGHLDHILGLAGLLSTLMRWETIEELNIYGSRNALDRIHDLLYGVVLRGCTDSYSLAIASNWARYFFLNGMILILLLLQSITVDRTHWVIVFQEKGRRPFLAEKAEALGIPPGPWRRRLGRRTPCDFA